MDRPGCRGLGRRRGLRDARDRRRCIADGRGAVRRPLVSPVLAAGEPTTGTAVGEVEATDVARSQPQTQQSGRGMRGIVLVGFGVMGRMSLRDLVQRSGLRAAAFGWCQRACSASGLWGVCEIAENWRMRVSAKADYAVRAALELASADSILRAAQARPDFSAAQNIPSKFLETIMLELKHAGIVKSTRGAEGGYALARPAQDISVADVIRAVDGPLANVRGERVETVEYIGRSRRSLRDLWVAVRASLRRVLESTSLQDVVEGDLPEAVRELTQDPEAWISLNRRRRPPAAK